MNIVAMRGTLDDIAEELEVRGGRILAMQVDQVSEELQAALPSATIEMFLQVLVSKLTQYDMKLSKRQPNIYRLGHLLKAAGEVREDVKSYLDRDDEEAMNALKKSLNRRFIIREMPPARNVIKQIDAWLSSQKLPSLKGR